MASFLLYRREHWINIGIKVQKIQLFSVQYIKMYLDSRVRQC